MTFRLGINTGFAVNRYAEPETWTQIIGEKLGLRSVQFTADLLNPSLPDQIIDDEITRIYAACQKYKITISSTFTGAFTRVNHLAHPNPAIRAYWVEWFKRFVDISVALGASSMGSHFGIFTAKDNSDAEARAERLAQNIEG
jgi:D-erythrulose 1-phosphate 3-epimerase